MSSTGKVGIEAAATVASDGLYPQIKKMLGGDDSPVDDIQKAAAFFIVWTGILDAGADHPLPAGFIWIVLLCLITAVPVYFRAPAYANWSAPRHHFRWL